MQNQEICQYFVTGYMGPHAFVFNDVRLIQHDFVTLCYIATFFVFYFRAVVLTTLMYGSGSWVLYRHHFLLLERFQQLCLHSFLNSHWRDFITDVEILKRAEVQGIKALLLKSQPCCVGHVSRMENGRPPKRNLLWLS